MPHQLDSTSSSISFLSQLAAAAVSPTVAEASMAVVAAVVALVVAVAVVVVAVVAGGMMRWLIDLMVSRRHRKERESP